MTKAIYADGHQILSYFNIDYESYIQEFVDELMSKPNQRFRLSLATAPLQKKK